MQLTPLKKSYLVTKNPPGAGAPGGFESSSYFSLPLLHQRFAGRAVPLTPLTRQGFGIVE